MSEPKFRPRLNHVAISVAPDVLDDRGRGDILAFFGEFVYLLPLMVEVQHLERLVRT